ncbi:VTT domain-containing protein [candidate division KSB1 bacterium]|nr:VTT domain-containing protein [candidate division KSB1 bacterium]
MTTTIQTRCAVSDRALALEAGHLSVEKFQPRWLSCLKNTISQLDKKWRVLILAVLGFAAMELLLVSLLPSPYRGLGVFVLYSVIANFIIPPMPHEPAIMLYGTLYAPWLVALVGCLAVGWIEFINYLVLKWAVALKPFRRMRDKRIYQKAETQFKKMPFAALVFAWLTPVPVAPFRVLAVTSGYSIGKYLVTCFLGRAPRYYVLAAAGAIVQLPVWVYVIPIVIVSTTALIRKIRNKKAQGSHVAISEGSL